MSVQYLFVVVGEPVPGDPFAFRWLFDALKERWLLASTRLLRRGTRMATSGPRRLLSATVAAALVLGIGVLAAPAQAAVPRPVLSHLSATTSATRGGGTVTVTGRNFVRVRYVRFGAVRGTSCTSPPPPG